MAINLKFDLMGNPEPPSIVLANRNGNKLGQLDVNIESIDVSDKFNAASEFSFTLNKYINNESTPLWDSVVDFKLVYCPEWDLWFEIKVELDESTETVKTVFCIQLGQAELSQIKLYNTEINTDMDIERDDFETSVLYDKDNSKYSILHRLLEKAPHYSIAYVDESIQRIQRQFSFDDTSICDAFNEIGEEIGCLFVYNSNSTKDGMPSRTISVYDLQQNCNGCGYRGEFTDKCPKCGSADIEHGYGEDTEIFVSNIELATEGIQLVTDTDSVKNCFKLEAGDDLMTATIRNCNPNGSDYIWYFSDAVKEDMSKELVEAIENYDSKYKEYYNTHIFNLDADLVSKYNALVDKYDEYYNTKSTCINCKHEGYFEDECPSCHSKNILTGRILQTIDGSINGYPALMNAYYNTIDLALYLKSGLMPTVEMSETNAVEQLNLLTTSSLSPVAVNVEKIDNVSLATANSAVLSMAKVIVKPTYKVEIKEGSASLSDNKVWSGQFIVTNYSDETDTAVNDENEYINVTINNDTETFIQQKINKALNKENTDDYSISGLFDEEKYNYDAFCVELKKYALNPLKSFYEACESCLSILTEQGTGNKEEKADLYNNLYEPYYKKSQAIAKEIKIREDEISIIEGVYEETDESNKKLIAKGLQTNIIDCQNVIHEELNFEEYLKKTSELIGRDLWLEFCAYRREDKYSNSNYVSDGLNNAELFERALEFVEVAENEIFKSAELQHSISTTLNNLLAYPKFKPLIKYFKTGNWIRVLVDDRIFKLRLLEYKFSYGDLKSIPVEFSDVIKIKNGITDVQNVFSQASSMASSYDSVQRQAKKGDVARNTIDQWIIDGLDSAEVQIKSNDSEEILLTKNGLLARSYDDITKTYSPEQFKLTHNIMAYTTDNWETVSSALGKHNYKYWENGNFIDAEDYGLTSRFVDVGHVIGSQIIGGEIISSNYKFGEDAKGTYINLIDGDFDFAGGKIVYDSEKNKVTLSGVTIQWDSLTDKPTIENIDGLSDIKDDIRAIEQGLQATTINDQYVISPHIVGGDLKIVGNDGTTSAQISNIGVLTATGANITGDITATSLTLGDGVKISTKDIDGMDEYAKLGDIVDVPDNIITTDDVIINESTTENGVTTQKITIGDNEYTSIISGDFILTNVGLGTNTEDGSQSYTCISKDGLLTAKNALIYGTVYATNGSFSGEVTATSGVIGGCEIENGVLKVDNIVTTEYVNALGINAGSITIKESDGDILFSAENNKVGIAGWKVDSNSFYHGNSFNSADMFLCTGSSASFSIGNSDEISGWMLKAGDSFGVTTSGVLYCNNAHIEGEVTATSGSFVNGDFDNCTINDTCVIKGELSGATGSFSGNVTAETLVATTAGQIGSWIIDSDIIRSTMGVYGTYSYTTTGTNLKTVTGYLFATLTSTGLWYVIKETSDYSSKNIVSIPSFIGFSVPNNMDYIIEGNGTGAEEV